MNDTTTTGLTPEQEARQAEMKNLQAGWTASWDEAVQASRDSIRMGDRPDFAHVADGGYGDIDRVRVAMLIEAEATVFGLVQIIAAHPEYADRTPNLTRPDDENDEDYEVHVGNVMSLIIATAKIYEVSALLRNMQASMPVYREAGQIARAQQAAEVERLSNLFGLSPEQLASEFATTGA